MNATIQIQFTTSLSWWKLALSRCVCVHVNFTAMSQKSSAKCMWIRTSQEIVQDVFVGGGTALLDVKNMVPVEIAIFGHITTRGHIQRCKLWLSLFRANEGLRGGK